MASLGPSVSVLAIESTIGKGSLATRSGEAVGRLVATRSSLATAPDEHNKCHK